MKKLFAILLLFIAITGHSQLIKKIGNKIKNKSEQRADQKVDQTIDKGLDKTEEATKKKDSKPDEPAEQPASQSPAQTGTVTTPEPSAPQSLKVYANYDFVPGDRIIFEDNFTGDQDGEFPSHWELENGQGILNKIKGSEAFFLTDGNYAIVTPLTKTKNYLGNIFTVEYDLYHADNGVYGFICFLRNSEGSDIGTVQIALSEAICNFAEGKSLSGTYPSSLSYDNYVGKWHHIAIAYKDKQIKVYVDQVRVLVVPNSGITPAYVTFGGIGQVEYPIIFRNVRIATGGNMNMIGKKFTETKIITHGINFDVNKATIKPESMGTLNMIVNVMKDNPDLKFEVGGHTDADGTDDANLKLSQQRADAVKDQLVKMGIDATRLTAKGYGESKPISDNTTMDGKANNRRVEFVKR